MFNGKLVTIEVYLDDVASDVDAVVIDGVEYKNGDVAFLATKNYTLTWQQYSSNAVFGYWNFDGDIGVENDNAESTTLTVSGSGTLALFLFT